MLHKHVEIMIIWLKTTQQQTTKNEQKHSRKKKLFRKNNKKRKSIFFTTVKKKKNKIKKAEHKENEKYSFVNKILFVGCVLVCAADLHTHNVSNISNTVIYT